ncbi:ABC-F family ATP-binding cassette domain-containing protein [Conexibacter sp. JD483]|uniref:ABC-F family ATP-binding cassette domain-containing protein n=1 Tax=unclassified Conexibacter TaxID=2627773 RepID=UPI00271A9311|nr:MULTISPECIES: ABC-F family ATP-binding cassette domain-containing protein [unclassified Conexibacter]MDO8186659.1 ABC-F family ATP-binding cassette domain-containing protein [Conexibacter sp. CPCC 205706]MDO8200379.1 ABC-F family ATP-binding cassette domain-containing protein [Conexibacter sp. CPCC 205762]MDR9370599.1 ABC-F family ATP-binding cassette domain-containing protein [Conexibacter sp. JD483]
MAVVIASDIGKDVAGSPLMRGISFKLERRDRMTLSGRNGAGKTTLLRMIAGQASIDVGELSHQKGAKIALHDQRPPREQDLTLRDYVLSGAREIVAVEQELARLEQRMADGDYEESTLNAYARAQARLEHFGGYRWRDNAQSMLHGLGFRDDALDRELSTFSGGQLTRASLARALAGAPDLLLLDEPTNHLDIASLEWLEQYLISMDSAIVLVAHDRWFLESVGTAVLELEAGRSRFFAGPWHKWRQEQAARELALGRAIDKQQAEIERLEKFVERFRAKATKARQAQSRVKRLERIERIERDPRDQEGLSFQFARTERAGRVIFELDEGRIEVPGKVLLERAELWLERGEHVALVGPNGTGKTTLIDTLAGQRPLPAGKLRTGHNIRLGYLSQHAENLGETGSVLDACQRATRLTPNKARALLGRFLFSGEEAQKPLNGLSGGERQRLSLAILVNSGANVLILDEPTNHLDVESREALEDALEQFDGSLLLVSHDRALLDAVGSRTVAIEDGRLNSYEGGWADYLRVREERRAAELAARERAGGKKPKASSNGGSSNGGGGGGAKKNAAKAAAPAPAKPALSKNAQREAKKLEREIEKAETALTELEVELADPDAWADAGRSAANSERHAAARRAVEELYARYEAVAG